MTAPGPPSAASLDGSLWIGVESYDASARAWLQAQDHYLGNAPPGCLFAAVVRTAYSGLAGIPIGGALRLGMCLVSRPVCRRYPQDGSVGEVTRMFLVSRLPHGTASGVLRFVADVARARGMTALIAYHDRTRHSGCIYRKAGFRRDGTTTPPKHGRHTRGGRRSGDLNATPKRRWRLELAP